MTLVFNYSVDWWYISTACFAWASSQVCIQLQSRLAWKIHYGLTHMPSCWCWLQTKVPSSSPCGLLASAKLNHLPFMAGQGSVSRECFKSRSCEVSWSLSFRISIISLLSHSIYWSKQGTSQPIVNGGEYILYFDRSSHKIMWPCFSNLP